jgi:hypothetical protein
MRRALNRDEISRWMDTLKSDATATIECMWRFAGTPSRVLVVSKPVENQTLPRPYLGLLQRVAHLLRASADGCSTRKLSWRPSAIPRALSGERDAYTSPFRIRHCASFSATTSGC